MLPREEIMAGPNRVLRFIGLIIGTVGILLVSISVWLLVESWWFSATAKHVEGVVTKIEYGERRANRSVTIYTFVEFHDEGRVVIFRSESIAHAPDFSVGAKVTVLYQLGKAEQARIENLFEQYFPPICLGIFGAACVVISGLYLIIPAQEWRRRQLVLTTGTPVKAKVIEVRIDASFRGNSGKPWVIVAEYKDEKHRRNHAFTSEFLWIDPTSYYSVGSEVTVYYLPQEPTKYAFVLDKIPETP
jgi:Protein of unknown function (DUF3592)